MNMLIVTINANCNDLPEKYISNNLTFITNTSRLSLPMKGSLQINKNLWHHNQFRDIYLNVHYTVI